MEKFVSESELMLNLDHPNILSIVGMCFNMEDTPAAIILPYMVNGDLKKFLATRRKTLEDPNEKYPKVNLFSCSIQNFPIAYIKYISKYKGETFSFCEAFSGQNHWAYLTENMHGGQHSPRMVMG